MSYEEYYNDPQLVKCEYTIFKEEEYVYYVREAWKKIYGEYPSDKSVAILYAQWKLETGVKYCRNGNIGNIKKTHANEKAGIKDDGHLFAMFTHVSEIINGKEVFFEPPHPQTHFRAYKIPPEGVEDYIKFLSQRKRYVKAWQAVIAGDPKDYSHQLKISGYYTASEVKYTAGIVRLTDYFNAHKAKLLSYQPPLPKPEEPKPIEPVGVVAVQPPPEVVGSSPSALPVGQGRRT